MSRNKDDGGEAIQGERGEMRRVGGGFEERRQNRSCIEMTTGDRGVNKYDLVRGVGSPNKKKQEEGLTVSLWHHKLNILFVSLHFPTISIPPTKLFFSSLTTPLPVILNPQSELHKHGDMSKNKTEGRHFTFRICHEEEGENCFTFYSV